MLYAEHSGVNLQAGGYITNAASGYIAGAVGIYLGGGTVTNAGTITGRGGTAVSFYGSTGGRVVVDPGAVFNGPVVGSTSAKNTLELASGAAAGTISGFGASFVNFGSVLVDRAAAWELTGSNTLAAGSTLTNSGTLTLSSATLSAGRVINNGRIELDPSTLNVASLTGTGTVTISAGDLFVSPHHAMYLDGVLIEAKDLINGVSIVQAEQVDQIDYFHIELEMHDVILAEGAPSETFVDDDSRSMFHNAHEYAALYPDDDGKRCTLLRAATRHRI